MAQVLVKPRLVEEHPLATVGGRRVHILEPGANLARELMLLSPNRWGGAHVELFAGSGEDAVDIASAPEITLLPGEYYVVRVYPAGKVVQQIFSGLLIVGGIIAAAFGFPQIGIPLIISGAGGLISSFLPQPKAPALPQYTPTSPADNPSSLNSLAPARNTARTGSRVSDIYGEVVIYPDLIFAAAEDWQWTDTKYRTSFSSQTITQVYCVGRGQYEIGEPKIDTSPLANFPSGEIAIYPPGAILPSTVRRRFKVVAADGAELISPSNGGDWTIWHRFPAETICRIEATIAWPRGIGVATGSGALAPTQTSVQIERRRIVNDVVVEEHSETLIAGTFKFLNPMVRTFAIEGITPGVWECRLRETATRADTDYTDTYIRTLVGTCKLTDAERTIGDYTAIVMTIRNDREAANQNVERFNVRVTRKLPAVEPNAAPATETLVATRRWIDAMAHTLRDDQIGNMADDEIDWLSLWAVHQSLEAVDGGEAALFDGAFDREVSADDQIGDMAAHARAAAFRQHGRLVVSRDERSAGPVALFNRRNRLIETGAVTRALQFRGPTDPDGIEITWLDRDADFATRTYRYPENVTLVQPRRLEVTGATHWSQVWRRAQYEWAVQRYRRRVAPVTVADEGRLLTVFDRISMVDPWAEGVVGGEVMEWEPATRTLRLDVPIQSGQFIRLRAPDGRSTELIACAKISQDTLILGATPSIEIVVPEEKGQIGTLANVSAQAADDQATTWVVLDITPQDSGAVLSVVFDDDAIYQMADDAAVPPRPAI